MPHREIMDGVLIIMGGAFLLTPGFITDIFGLVLLLPPTRAVVRRVAGARAAQPGDAARAWRAWSSAPGPRPARPPTSADRGRPRIRTRELPPG